MCNKMKSMVVYSLVALNNALFSRHADEFSLLTKEVVASRKEGKVVDIPGLVIWLILVAVPHNILATAAHTTGARKGSYGQRCVMSYRSLQP